MINNFPGGTVAESPPANAGDMGSVPGPGRSHMLWSNGSPCVTATEARVPYSPHPATGEVTAMRSLRSPTETPLTTTRESPGGQQSPSTATEQ